MPRNLGRGGLLTGYKPPKGPQNLGRGNLLNPGGRGATGGTPVASYPGMGAPGANAYASQQETAPPPDPAFLAQQAQAQLAMGLGNAWDTYSRGRVENDYGLGADASNPYSRAKLLEQSYQQNQRGTDSSYANAGQLYSGAYQSAKNYDARNYAIGQDRLQREYQGAKDQITKGSLDRYSQYGNLAGADLQSLLKQLGLG